jgi:hypothetical protein
MPDELIPVFGTVDWFRWYALETCAPPIVLRDFEMSEARAAQYRRKQAAGFAVRAMKVKAASIRRSKRPYGPTQKQQGWSF